MAVVIRQDERARAKDRVVYEASRLSESKEVASIYIIR